MRVFSRLICRIKFHNYLPAGRCPFTNTSYQTCKRCGDTKPEMEITGPYD